MSGMETNAGSVASGIAATGNRVERAVRAGVAQAAFAIERAQINNLSGGGDPYSYPVPVRTGHLRRSAGVEQPHAHHAIVFNAAAYAWAVHSGEVNEWRSHYAGPGEERSMSVLRRPRPFLDDAVKRTPYLDIVVRSFVGALRAGGQA